MGEGIEVRLLGRIEMLVAGRAVPLRPQQMAVLSHLALHAGSPVGVTELVDTVWGDAPSASARRSVQVLVSRMRAVLDEACAEGGRASPPRSLIITHGPTYQLDVDRSEVDALRAEDLIDAGRRARAAGDEAAATDALGAALELWRGEPLAGLADSATCRAHRVRLAELRLAAVEERNEAGLALGRHAELVAGIEGDLQTDPFREGLWRQLMVALYRSGRQADALRAFQRARSILVQELGIEPGQDLRRMESMVIAHDPALEAPSRGVTPSRGGELPEALAWARRQRVVPLVGRTWELGFLDTAWTEASRGTGGVVLLGGEPGVGKTRLLAELAVRAMDDGAVVLSTEATAMTVTAGAAQDLLFGHPALASLEPSRRADPRALGAALVDAVSSAGGPVLVLVDDLDATDGVSRAALRHLVTEVARLDVLVVATDRSDQGAATEAMSADLVGGEGRLMPRVERIEVERLPAAESTALLEERLGVALRPESRLGATTVAVETGGNAGVVIELARHLRMVGVVDGAGVWSGGVGVADVGVPEGVRASLSARLSALGPLAGEAIAAASVIGTQFDVAAVAAATERDAEAVATALDEAIAARLVVDLPGPNARRAFASTILRVVALERLSIAARERFQRRVAVAETARRPRPDAVAGADQNLRSGDVAGAWELYGQAAELARQAGDAQLLGQAALGAVRVLWYLNVSHPPVLDLLYEARRALPREDPLRAEVTAAAIRLLTWAGLWQEAIALGDED